MTDDPPLPPRPRQARAVAARSRVYAETMRQFAEKGVPATRVEDVVAAAEVAWGTFYRWFPRKQDVLLEAIVLHVREHALPVLDAGLADPARSARDTALAWFTALLEPGDHPPHVHGEALQEVVMQRERFITMLGDGEQPLVMLAARVVAHGQARGEVRTDLDQFTLGGTLLAGTAFSAIYGYYGAFRGFPGAQPAADLPALVERFFGIVWRGLERAPAALA